MKKKYNIFIISRLYLKNYYKYLISKTDIQKSSEAYDLFMYCMKKIYKLDAVEYSSVIDKYSTECIKELKCTKGTPRNIDILSFEDRVRVISVCEGYAKAIGLLTTETIKNSRI
jgi:hypothetical protein